MQTHYLPTEIGFGRKSRARWALSPGGRAAVFIHGFGGDPIGTWTDFQELLTHEEKCASHDFLFYGYDGLRRKANYSASQFRQLLHGLLTRPALDIVNPSLPLLAPRRDADFKFRRVTIVAHSLGAVIARRALLDLGRDQAVLTSLGRVRLVLFAPAHMGADLIALAALALNAIKLRLLEPIMKFRWPTLRDLDVKSKTLRLLAKHTNQQLRQAVAHGTPTGQLIAELVIHAEYDNVVNDNQFCSDPPLTPFAGKGHIDVCKPNASYQEPVMALLPHL